MRRSSGERRSSNEVSLAFNAVSRFRNPLIIPLFIDLRYDFKLVSQARMHCPKQRGDSLNRAASYLFGTIALYVVDRYCRTRGSLFSKLRCSVHISLFCTSNRITYRKHMKEERDTKKFLFYRLLTQIVQTIIHIFRIIVSSYCRNQRGVFRLIHCFGRVVQQVFKEISPWSKI